MYQPVTLELKAVRTSNSAEILRPSSAVSSWHCKAECQRHLLTCSDACARQVRACRRNLCGPYTSPAVTVNTSGTTHGHVTVIACWYIQYHGNFRYALRPVCFIAEEVFTLYSAVVIRNPLLEVAPTTLVQRTRQTTDWSNSMHFAQPLSLPFAFFALHRNWFSHLSFHISINRLHP